MSILAQDIHYIGVFVVSSWLSGVSGSCGNFAKHHVSRDKPGMRLHESYGIIFLF